MITAPILVFIGPIPVITLLRSPCSRSAETRSEMGKAPPLPPSEWTVDRMKKYHFAYTGSVKDVRKGMDALVEAGNPEYFAWLSDQGMLPLEVVKQQLRTFGEEVLPHYRS